MRRLAGFDRKRHRVPDQVNAATQAFLARLCEDELAEACEAMFQAARDILGYKRKDISLSLGAGAGRLESKDFALELRYFLNEEEPSRYVAETELASAAGLDLLESAAFDAVVGSRFDRVRCGLRGSVSVEAVIDAVEADESGDLSVEYPSSCAECSVRIDGVDAEVVIDGVTLEARIGRMSTAGELLRVFAASRGRFAANERLARLLA